MEGIKGKIRSTSILKRFKGIFLRLYGADLAFQDSLIGQKEVARKATFADSYHYSQREIGRAILKAEHSRAMVLAERQKHPRLC